MRGERRMCEGKRGSEACVRGRGESRGCVWGERGNEACVREDGKV